MTLEAPEPEQAAVEAKEKYGKSQADFAIEKEHYQRLLEAARTPGAISPLDISTVKANMEADSVLCNATKANWQMQEIMMSCLRITAPFSGVTTTRNVNPGALVSAADKDKPMLELKQNDLLRLQIDIPETMSSMVNDKDTVLFYVDALPGKMMKAMLCRNSDNINNNYRSQRMEADINNSEELLAPGMYADVTLRLKGNASAMYVPKSSVVISAESKYVLSDHNNTIRKIQVTTGNESDGKIEVFGDLQPGKQVIVNANDEIKETENHM